MPTGIAADVRATDHGRAGLGRRVLAVVTMFAGAVGGALLVLHAGPHPRSAWPPGCWRW